MRCWAASDIEIKEFELQWHYYLYVCSNILGKGMNPLIPPPSDELSSTTIIRLEDYFGNK